MGSTLQPEDTCRMDKHMIQWYVVHNRLTWDPKTKQVESERVEKDTPCEKQPKREQGSNGNIRETLNQEGY